MDNREFESLLFKSIDGELSQEEEIIFSNEVKNDPSRKAIVDRYKNLYSDEHRPDRKNSLFQELDSPLELEAKQSSINKVLNESIYEESAQSQKSLQSILNQPTESIQADSPNRRPRKSWQAIEGDSYLGKMAAILALLAIIIIGYIIDRKWASSITKDSDNSPAFQHENNDQDFNSENRN